MKSQELFCSGNEAIAEALCVAQVKLVVGYPGTPVTEIIETLKKLAAKHQAKLKAKHSGFSDSGFPDADFPVRAHWAVNEKVAFEMALGAALNGARSVVTMKHVGLNVAADPLMTSAYAGVNGGFVIITADDPHMYSSQNEQDNRHYALFAKLPMLEPSDGNEAFRYTQLAFMLSEKFNTPVILRLTMRVCHSYGIVEPSAHSPEILKTYFPPTITYPPAETTSAFNKQDSRTIMLPSIGRVRHKLVEDRMLLLEKFSNLVPFHQFTAGHGRTLIITAGVAYHYLKESFEALPILKLGMTYPIPAEQIKLLAEDFDEIIVVEELDPFIERELLVQGIPYTKLRKRNRSFYLGELSPERTLDLLLHNHEDTETRIRENPKATPNPPRLCSGCPHLTISNLLRELNITVSGDIGCYTLAALEPFQSLHTVIDMGASIPIMLGMQLTPPPPDLTASEAVAAAEPSVEIDSQAPLPPSIKTFRQDPRARIAVIGDSTFIHSGMTGLLEASTLSPDGVICLLDNRTTAMTGQQAHAGNPNGINSNENVSSERKVDYLKLANALGITQAYKCDPYDLKAARSLLHRALGESGISVIVFERACALLPAKPKSNSAQKLQNQDKVSLSESAQDSVPESPRPVFTPQLPRQLTHPAEVRSNCVKCGECLRVGCPSIQFSEPLGRPQIQASSCIGCGICLAVCEYDALQESKPLALSDLLTLSKTQPTT